MSKITVKSGFLLLVCIAAALFVFFRPRPIIQEQTASIASTIGTKSVDGPTHTAHRSGTKRHLPKEIQNKRETKIDDSFSELVPVKVKVTLEGSGRAAPEVEVLFERNGQFSSEASNADGNIEIYLLPGTYKISAMGENYIGKEAIQATVTDDFDDVIDILVTTMLSIHGTIRTKEGQTLSGAHVSAQTDTAKTAILNPGHLAGAQTSADGRFQLTVPPQCQALQIFYNDQFFFHALPDSPKKQSLGQNIVLDLSASLSIKVTSPSGKPAFGAELLVSASRFGGSKFYNQTTYPLDDQGGLLVSDLRPGRYILEATHPEWASSQAKIIRLKSGKQEDLLLPLQTPITYTVVASDSKNKPLDDVSIRLVPHKSKRKHRPQRTNQDGTVLFRNIGAGQHSLYAKKSGYKSFKTAITPSNGEQTTIKLKKED